MIVAERLLLAALSTYGEREEAGPKRNFFIGALIDRWFRKGADDSTAWCGIWMADVVSRCGLNAPLTPFRAKSWSAVGREVLDAQPGDVVVLYRGRNLYHVALVVRVTDDKETLWCIGGNQGDSVSIRAFRAADVYAIRRLG